MMIPTELVNLKTLMARTRGRPDLKIGLIDGPVLTHHPDLATEHLQEIDGSHAASFPVAACTQADSTACLHGTFIAGILAARRDSAAPAICPDCTVLVRPVFSETSVGRDHMPSATPEELAAAVLDCVNAGARIINLSLALAQPSIKGEGALDEAFNQALSRGVLVAAAAGNQGTLGSSAITRHPWVIPVVACDESGRPVHESNLGGTIGTRGLSAPGDAVTSLGTNGEMVTLGGTSVAVPFVTGAIALLWSEFPKATAGQIKLAVTQAILPRRASVVPPLLDAEWARHTLAAETARRQPALNNIGRGFGGEKRG